MNKRISTIMVLFLLCGLGGAEFKDYITLEWKLDDAKIGITDLYAFDLDGDGSKELIGTSYDGNAYVWNSKGELSWNVYLLCTVYSVYVTDLEDDGQPEILIGSCKPLDILTSEGERIFRYSTTNSVTRIAVDDLDKDGIKEMLFSSSEIRTHTIYLMDKESKILWQKKLGGSYYPSLFMGDIDGDGVSDIVLGGGKYVSAYDPEGNQKWKYRVDGEVTDMDVGDIDGDGAPDIVVAASNAYAVDNKGQEKWKFQTAGRVADIKIDDLDNDGQAEIIVGADQAYILDSGGNLLWNYSVPTEIRVVGSGDLDFDNESEVVIGSDDIHVLDSDGSLQWQYSPYRRVSKILVDDLENDGKPDLIVGSLDTNVYIFKGREIYLGEQKSTRYYKEAQEFFNSGDYEGAKIQIEKAIAVNDKWGVGECKDTDKCGILLQQIEDKIPETTTSTEETTTIEIEETSSIPATTITVESTIPKEDAADNTSLIMMMAVVIILAVVAVFLIKKKGGT